MGTNSTVNRAGAPRWGAARDIRKWPAKGRQLRDLPFFVFDESDAFHYSYVV